MSTRNHDSRDLWVKVRPRMTLTLKRTGMTKSEVRPRMTLTLKRTGTTKSEVMSTLAS
ncbi:hypothetical protein Taro_007458 [Colocasia esculenta]|uniref:Uncharacterized protein n=1 Tax=Colocasia esculenta TaxID=4460 RepID=A0A843U0F6_COLES|nr:hypothetical protein [Colocasia esculenta]